MTFAIRPGALHPAILFVQRRFHARFSIARFFDKRPWRQSGDYSLTIFLQVVSRFLIQFLVSLPHEDLAPHLALFSPHCLVGR
jgi:hypothetical protein